MLTTKDQDSSKSKVYNQTYHKKKEQSAVKTAVSSSSVITVHINSVNQIQRHHHHHRHHYQLLPDHCLLQILLSSAENKTDLLHTKLMK